MSRLHSLVRAGPGLQVARAASPIPSSRALGSTSTARPSPHSLSPLMSNRGAVSPITTHASGRVSPAVPQRSGIQLTNFAAASSAIPSCIPSSAAAAVPPAQPRRSFASIPVFAWGSPMRLSPGDSCTLKRSFSASDVQAFGTASGDWNPVHYPEKHAKVTQLETEKWRADPKTKDLPLPTTGIFRFPKPIVHGMLTASLIGTLFATHLPGSIYLQQSLQFRAPVFYDEQVVAKIEVISVDRKRVLCKTTVEKIDASGKTIVCVEGEARVMVDSLQA